MSTIDHITPPIPSKPASMRFAQSALPNLGPVTRSVGKTMDWLHASRGRELLVMDLIGFTGLRTLMDLCREYLFKRTQDGKRELNLASGLERLGLELLGAASDGVGILAYGLGWLITGKRNTYSNQFTSLEALDLFKNTLGTMPKHASREKAIEGFMQKLAAQLAPHLPKVPQETLAKTIQNIVLQNGNSKSAGQQTEQAALKIAKTLNQSHFDMEIGKKTFALQTLLEDTQALVKAVPAKSTKFWTEEALRLVSSALKVNYWRIPACLAAGIAFNFFSPFLVHVLTKKVFGYADYPGEKGLRELKKDRTHRTSVCPYLTESLKKGNPLPLLISLVPVPIILGLVNTETWGTTGSLRKAFNNPLKMGLKAYGKNFLAMMQFGRRLPFIGAQMMALLYAIVVFSRVATARTPVEFRERAVDAFMGWTTWILLTPLLTKAVSKLWDKNLVKTLASGLEKTRTASEIKHFVTNPALKEKLLKANIWISFTSAIATMLLLGVVEPYISIRISEWQSRREVRKKAEKAQKQRATHAQTMKLNAAQHVLSPQAPATPLPFVSIPMGYHQPANAWNSPMPQFVSQNHPAFR